MGCLLLLGICLALLLGATVLCLSDPQLVFDGQQVTLTLLLCSCFSWWGSGLWPLHSDLLIFGAAPEDILVVVMFFWV